jgi:hypothetical protein
MAGSASATKMLITVLFRMIFAGTVTNQGLSDLTFSAIRFF